MGNAGLAEQLPVVALDGRLVAHHQGRQHTGHTRVAHLAKQRIANRLAQPLDRMGHTVGQALRAPTRLARLVGLARLRLGHPHIAGGANALLKPHQLGIEHIRVDRGVGLLQPHRQAPTLAGAQVQPGVVQRRLVLEVDIPAQ